MLLLLLLLLLLLFSFCCIAHIMRLSHKCGKIKTGSSAVALGLCRGCLIFSFIALRLSTAECQSTTVIFGDSEPLSGSSHCIYIMSAST